MWSYLRNSASDEAKAVIAACVADPLFYINSFLWGYDPRVKPQCRPVITWDAEDQLIRICERNFRASILPENEYRRFDVGIDKGRDLGATLMALAFIDWLWRFHADVTMHCISAKEDRVDNPKDLSALFPKLDYFEARLPWALQVRGQASGRLVGRTDLKIVNFKNGSVITGEASGPNAGRGGRYLLCLRDEEAACDNGERITAALSDTTKMQLRISTPNGIGGSFHNAKIKGGIDWMTLHWTQHPLKARGLYRVNGDRFEILDRAWAEANPGYDYKLGPTHADPGAAWEFLRSPWFDETESKADSVKDIAQEHQVAYIGSGAPFFSPTRLSITAAKQVQEPIWRGFLKDLVTGCDDLQDQDARPFRCKVWYDPLEKTKKPPQQTSYSMGIDIAAGTGASDSVVSVGDDASRVKVFEFYTNGMRPETFAVAVKRMSDYFTTPLGRPFLAWDRGAHGQPFGDKLMELGDVQAYYYTDTKGSTDDVPGLPFAKRTKLLFFSIYRSALFEGEFVTRSAEAYRQAEQFVFDGSPQGGVAHQRSLSTDNDSERGEQHGDIVTSEVVLVIAQANRPRPAAIPQDPPFGSPAWMEQAKKRERQQQQSMFQPGYVKNNDVAGLTQKLLQRLSR